MQSIDPRYLGPIVTTLGIGVSVTLWLLNVRRKQLSYEIISDESIIGVQQQSAGSSKTSSIPTDHLEIMVQGEAVKNVRQLKLRIINSGHLPIRAAEFDGSIKIKFGPNAKVLSAEITESYPQNIEQRGAGDSEPTPLLSKFDDQTLAIRPVLFNGKDFVTLKMLVKDFSELDIHSHIEGIADIKRTRESNSLPLALVNAGSFVMAISLFYLDPKDFANNHFMGYIPFLVFYLIGYNMLLAGLNFSKVSKLLVRRADG